MRWKFNVRGQRFSAIAAAIAGFLLPWQTVWLLRAGILSGQPYALADVGLFLGDFILLGFAAVGVVVVVRKRKASLVILSFVLFLLIALLNILRSPDQLISAVGWLRVMLLAGAIVGVSALPGIRRHAVFGFVVAMTAHAALGIVQVSLGAVLQSTLLGIAPHDAATLGTSVLETAHGRYLRAYGGLPHPNVLGTALLVGVIGVAALWERRGNVLLLASLGVQILALVLTFSRAAWLGLAVLLVVLLRHQRTRTLAAVGVALAVTLVVLLFPLVRTRFIPSNRLEMLSTAQRFASLDDARALLAAHPTIGVGLHAMPQTIASAQPGRAPTTIEPVHNVPLLAFVEVGTLGAIAVVFLLVAVLIFAPGFSPSFAWLALAPTLLFDHHLWSLAAGPALILALMLVSARAKMPSP